MTKADGSVLGRVNRRHALAAGLVLPWTRLARAEGRGGSVDARARWLAGLSPADGAEDPGEWGAYAAAQEQRWREIEPRRKAMTDWSSRQIAPLLPPGASLFYPFAGPDALHALALFGPVKRMMLVGLEPVGTLPELGRAAPGYFKRLGGALDDVFRLTFFRTREMSADFEKDGVLAALVVTIIRSGGTIAKVTTTRAEAVRIDWTHADGQGRQLEYFRMDLANAALMRHEAFLADVRAAAPVVTFVKAAMYLLAESRFSRSRQMILEDSAVVVQDDTGVPFRHFDSRWAMRFFGRYDTPVTPFEERAQPDLRSAFERGGAMPMPFGLGYHVRPDRSNLIIASKGSR